jgi:hypothetical protein
VTFFRYTLGLLLSVAISLTLSVRSAVAQFPPSPQSAAFTGAWCAQGDPSKHASIADNGGFLTLTNETGDTSPGQYQGKTSIVAPGWQFVTGTLSPDGSQINWSNGTFWARCNSGGGRRRSSTEPNRDVVCPGGSFSVLLHPSAGKQPAIEQRIGWKCERPDEREADTDDQLERNHHWGNGE